MPGAMNGLVLAGVVRNRWPPIEIIIVSGMQMPPMAQLAERAVFFSKPYDARKVKETLARMAARLTRRMGRDRRLGGFAALGGTERNRLSCLLCIHSSRYVSTLLGEEMTENEELTREIGLLADRAESDPETGVDIKALAVGLWASFNEFSIEEIEDALRDAWRMRGLAFNDNAGN